MNSEIRLSTTHALWVCLAACVWICGCATLPSADRADGPPEPAILPDNGVVMVEIRPAMGEPVRWSGPVSEGMTVQNVLEKSGAAKKIRAPQIDLVRKVPDQYQPLRMRSEYKPGTRRVKYEEDYAIHPGDRILVRPKEVANPIEKFLGKR